MPSHSERPGIWLSVWRFLLIHCLYERAAKVLARLRGRAGSPEPSLLAYAISTKFAWRGPVYLNMWATTMKILFLFCQQRDQLFTPVSRHFYAWKMIFICAPRYTVQICFLRARCPSLSNSIAIELNVPRDDFSSIPIELMFVTLIHGFKNAGSVLFDICAPGTRTF